MPSSSTNTSSPLSKLAALFSAEGPQFYQQAFQHNAPFATKGPYQTQLAPAAELLFRLWLSQNKVPFNPDESTQDYDMRGFWQAMQNGQVPQWQGGKHHFPDTFKTPYDTTFSKESKYATPNNPFAWQGDSLIDTRTGQVVFAPPK